MTSTLTHHVSVLWVMPVSPDLYDLGGQAMGQELDPSGSRMGVLLQELEAAAEEALSSGGDRKAKVRACLPKRTQTCALQILTGKPECQNSTRVHGLLELEAAVEEALSSGGTAKPGCRRRSCFDLQLNLLEPLWSAGCGSSSSIFLTSWHWAQSLQLHNGGAGMTAACMRTDLAQHRHAGQVLVLVPKGTRVVMPVTYTQMNRQGPKSPRRAGADAGADRRPRAPGTRCQTRTYS